MIEAVVPRTAIRLKRSLEVARNLTLGRLWPPYSRLFLANDGAEWSLAEESRYLGHVARELGVRVASTETARGARRQSVFYVNQFVLLDDRFFGSSNRLAVSYYHGRTADPGLLACFDALRRRHARLERVHVSCREMRNFVLTSGIDPAKVFLIPIGIELALFPRQTPASREEARRRLGLAPEVPVVGSFQKDGVGWGLGEEPKLIKGPDVLMDVIARLREELPGLHVLLSGPARGYVRARLDRLGVPYRHVYPRAFREVGGLYQALDAYLVTSREEGGPKAVLESMASGVPLITTRVGQAADLVRHGENGWITDVEDVGSLVLLALHALRERSAIRSVLDEGRLTAERHSIPAQSSAWRSFFYGFVGI